MAEVFSLISRLYGEVKKNGVSNTYYKVKEKQAKNEAQKDYEAERLAALPTATELKAQRGRNFMKDITFSIVVPTYQTPEKFLRQMIESVLGQTFCRVELILADGSNDDSVEKIVSEYAASDERIKYKRLNENRGISENTNEGLKLATGEYIGLLDHDDILELHALYEMRMAIAKNPEADVLYSDEDKVSFDLTSYFEPHYKPDFNPDLLRSNNYICHFLVFKRELLEQVGGFRSEYDGAQDFDLVLRLTEKASCVVHIPKVLYHWRSHDASKLVNICLPGMTGVQGSVGGENWCVYEDLNPYCDTATIMSYGMAWAGSAPGPVSPRDWLEGIYDYAVRVMTPEKIFL